MNYIYNKGEVVNGSVINEQTTTTYGIKKKILLKSYIATCLTCSYVFKATEGSLKRGGRCPCCTNKVVVEGVNDIATTHPYLVKYFVNKEESKKYSAYSKKILSFKCCECGNTKDSVIHYITANNGFSCELCGDGFSKPEKFMSLLLKEIGCKYIPQATKRLLKWAENKKYDFYIPSLNCIIETNGIQHYVNSTRGRTLEEEKTNDIIKEKLAKDNGIKHYVVLDCRKSSLEWLKNNIMNSELPILLNFKEEDIDWNSLYSKTLDSKVKDVCDMWNNTDKGVNTIANHLQLNRTTVLKYLKIGNELGMCTYSTKESKRRMGKNNCKKIYVVELDKVFNNVEEISKAVGEDFNPASVRRVCYGERKTYKGYHFHYIV